MSGRPVRDPPSNRNGGGNGELDQQDVFNLLRYTHIFAAAVQEMLELKLLREISSDALTLSQLHLLKLISLNGQHQVGEVADFLGVSAPAASKNIDKLERLGLVAREQSLGDRRAILLSSSRKGRELVGRYEALKAKRLTPVLESFEAEDLRSLTQLLERFSVALIDSDETGEGLCFRCSAYFDDNCPVAHFHEGCPYQKVRLPREGMATEKEA